MLQAPLDAGARSDRANAGSVPSEGHLLLVDDDPTVRTLYRRFLEAKPLLEGDGAAVVHDVGSGEEAVALVERLLREGRRVAFAVVDYRLGGIDGVETIRRIWQLDADVHCALVTGAGAAVEDEIEGRLPDRLLDRWDFLAKPFTQFELRTRVRRGLASWRASRSEERQARKNDELLRELARANADLERQVEDRTKALAHRSDEQERKAKELERALRELELAQSRLLQQEKMASIGQLAAGVAHELNNPIGYVHSNLGTLGRYFEKIRKLVDVYDSVVPAEGDARAAIAKVKEELKLDVVLEDLPSLIRESMEGTDRVRKIVSDLKIFSHPAENDAGYADLNEGLRSTLNIVWNELKYRAKVNTEFGDIPRVHCVAGQINQVFMNILVNASQALQGQGEITIRTRADGDHVAVDVTDTGCGIAPEHLSRVFDPFFTTKEVGKGTGLGLSISLDIVRRHGGEILVRSEVGKGSTFTVRLPVDGRGGANGRR